MTMDELRARHVPVWEPMELCAHDRDDWPCDFIRADDERRKLLAELGIAFDAMAEACKWAASETPRFQTIAQTDRHIAGYDALLDATVRAGRASGKLRAALDEVKP